MDDLLQVGNWTFANLGISTLMGIGSGLKSIKAAWAMRNVTIGGKLGYLGNIARASGVTSIEVGQGFYRPLGERMVIVARDALRNPWRLAGGFFHELAHVLQEFGASSPIAKPLQRLSAATTRVHPLLAISPTYLMNPVEAHAASSGLSSLYNRLFLLNSRLMTGGIQMGLNWGCGQ